MLSGEQKFRRTNFRFIDVRHFSELDLMDPEYRTIMNAKVDQIKEKYEQSLLQLEDLIGRQYDKIVSFRALEQLGNVGISFDEQTPDQVI